MGSRRGSAVSLAGTQLSPTGRRLPDVKAMTCGFVLEMEGLDADGGPLRPVPRRHGDRQDPDHTRTNLATITTSSAITAVQGLASAVRPADQEPAGVALAEEAGLLPEARAAAPGLASLAPRRAESAGTRCGSVAGTSRPNPRLRRPRCRASVPAWEAAHDHGRGVRPAALARGCHQARPGGVPGSCRNTAPNVSSSQCTGEPLDSAAPKRRTRRGASTPKNFDLTHYTTFIDVLPMCSRSAPTWLLRPLPPGAPDEPWADRPAVPGSSVREVVGKPAREEWS
ncbi:hypothetical protein EDD92_0838 [Streptomyces sp. TLI_185]|nr:hypothetical protein EDD92_0838 [Streptomyces sp. TLI_185]